MNTEKITKERLLGWEKKCNSLKSTPQVLITINPTTSQVGLIVTEDIEIGHVKALLTKVLLSL